MIAEDVALFALEHAPSRRLVDQKRRSHLVTRNLRNLAHLLHYKAEVQIFLIFEIELEALF